jgi:acylphosphatase
MSKPTAMRITITGDVSDLSLQEDVRLRAASLGLFGWIRLMEDDTLCVQAEGERGAIDEMASSLRDLAVVDSVSDGSARVEGA